MAVEVVVYNNWHLPANFSKYMKMGGQGILSEYFFEGTEKLLEVWFECSVEDERADLRIIDR